MRTNDTHPKLIPPPSKPLIPQKVIDDFVAEETARKGWTAEQIARFRTLLPPANR